MFKKLVFLVLVVVLLFPGTAFASGNHFAKGSPFEWLPVCHKPGTPAEKTKWVPEPAVAAHLNHGDYLGECGSMPVVPTTTVEKKDTLEIQQSPWLSCIDTPTVLLTVEDSDLLLINLETGEKNLITEDSSGIYKEGSFLGEVCPSIVASVQTQGEKFSDIREIKQFSAGIQMLRWTLTPQSQEATPDGTPDGGVFYTRGSLITSVYYIDRRGENGEQIVPGGSNPNFGMLSDHPVLLYQKGEKVFSLIDDVEYEIGVGSNPSIHPSGAVLFIRDHKVVYADNPQMNQASETEVDATDIAVASHGPYVVIVVEGEAWLYSAIFSSNGLQLQMVKRLTDLEKDGEVSFPDIYVPSPRN